MRSLCLLVGVLAFNTAAQAGFVGRTLDANYHYPDAGTVYSQASFTPHSFVVGPGVETIGNVENVTTLPVDFTDNQLTITLNTVLTNPTWTAASFNGPIFDLLSAGTLGINGASINASTTLAGFGIDRVTFSDSQIGINWNGLTYHDGDKVVVDFTFASAVPEPSTMAGFVFGLVGVVGYGLRRRRAA